MDVNSGTYQPQQIGMLHALGTGLMAMGAPTTTAASSIIKENVPENNFIKFQEMMNSRDQASINNQYKSILAMKNLVDAERRGSPQNVFRVNPVTGAMEQAGEVPFGSRVVNAQGNVPPSEAGRYTLSKESVKSLGKATKLLFPDGTPKSFNRELAGKIELTSRGKKIPNDKDSQNAFRWLSTALSGRQLIQTGVAARPEETAMLVKQFMVEYGSNPEALMEGFTQLSDFYKDYQSTVSTRGSEEIKPVGEDDVSSMSDDALKELIARSE
jgi:hypothetical protein